MDRAARPRRLVATTSAVRPHSPTTRGAKPTDLRLPDAVARTRKATAGRAIPPTRRRQAIAAAKRLGAPQQPGYASFGGVSTERHDRRAHRSGLGPTATRRRQPQATDDRPNRRPAVRSLAGRRAGPE